MIPPSAQLLAKGWPQHKIRDRHLGYAGALLEEGVLFERLRSDDRKQVAALVREFIPGMPDSWHVDHRGGGAVARDAQGAVIGALVLGVAVFGEVPYVYVHEVVVRPEWRGSGVAVVMMGILDQVLPAEVKTAQTVFYGQCAAENARFFQKVGFTVLQPGESIMIGQKLVGVPESSNQPCWFVREATLA